MKDEISQKRIEIRVKEILMLNGIEEESFDEWSLIRRSLILSKIFRIL